MPSRTDAPVRRAELLATMSLAEDVAVGLPKGYILRTAYVAVHLARELRLGEDHERDAFYTALLKDAGCTCYTTQIAAFIHGDDQDARRAIAFVGDYTNNREMLAWLKDYVGKGAGPARRASRFVDFAFHGRDFFREGFQSAGDVAQRIARRLSARDRVIEALPALFEHWNGRGMPYGLRGDAIPIAARIVCVGMFTAVWHMLNGRAAATSLARNRRGKAFDPEVADAFLSLAERPVFWEGLEQESVRQGALAMEPQPAVIAQDDTIDALALTFADFVDMKSIYMTGHSRRVADLSVPVAKRLGLSDETTIRRAALMHDVGHVASPSFSLNKTPEALTSEEQAERSRHPLVADEILRSAPVFEQERKLIAHHHERVDGTGYPHRLSGDDIPLESQVIAAADAFDDLTHNAPDRGALTLERAVERLRADWATAFVPDVLDALIAEVGGEPKNQPRPNLPAGLTGREIEVLRLLAQGLSRREIAQHLVLSEATVRHHLEHIYRKAGVSTRVAAVLFAVEEGLLE